MLGRNVVVGVAVWIAACGAEQDQQAAPGSAKAASPSSAASAAPERAAATAGASARATSEGGTPEQPAADKGGFRGPADEPIPAMPSPQAMPSQGQKPTMLAAVAFDLEGKLTGKEVQETIDQHRDKFTPCLSSDATVTVRAKVQPSGTLSDVSVTNSVPNEPKLRDCVASVLRGLTFPKPKGGAAVSLTLDLTLSRKLSF